MRLSQGVESVFFLTRVKNKDFMEECKKSILYRPWEKNYREREGTTHTEYKGFKEDCVRHENNNLIFYGN